MFGIGIPELVLIAIVALVVVGPKRLPTTLRALGRAIAEFRRASQQLRESVGYDEVVNEVTRPLREGLAGIKDDVLKLHDEQGENYSAEYPEGGVDDFGALPENAGGYSDDGAYGYGSENPGLEGTVARGGYHGDIDYDHHHHGHEHGGDEHAHDHAHEHAHGDDEHAHGAELAGEANAKGAGVKVFSAAPGEEVPDPVAQKIINAKIAAAQQPDRAPARGVVAAGDDPEGQQIIAAKIAIAQQKEAALAASTKGGYAGGPMPPPPSGAKPPPAPPVAKPPPTPLAKPATTPGTAPLAKPAAATNPASSSGASHADNGAQPGRSTVTNDGVKS